MILRTVTLAGGLAGAVGLSQFPEFSQQYVQRLGGAVDALAQVVADFDASATAEGLSRDQALAQMTGAPFIERRRADMARSIARHSQLAADLDHLKGQGPFMRAYNLSHLTDSQIAQAAWHDYQPALPLSFAGAIFAALGFLGGAFGVGAVIRLVTLPFRRRVSAPSA